MNTQLLFVTFLRASLRRSLAVLVLLGWCIGAIAQTCGIPGWDGAATPSGFINTYHAGSGTAAATQKAVTVASTTGQRTNTRILRAGDLVLIMQMQDATTPANAGLHEYAVIASISGSVLTLNNNLTNTYVQNVTTNLLRTFQVVYVPQYASAALSGAVTVDRWTISTAGAGTGGIVAMDVAGSLALTGTIDVSGAGFRGGAAVNSSSTRAGGLFSDLNYVYSLAAANGGVKGEGTTGTPIVVFDGTATPVDYSALTAQGYTAGSGGQAAQGNAGGGANDGSPAAGNGFNSGGGGGSNGGAGGQGGYSWNTQNDAGGRGAGTITANISKLVLGGGGGAGGVNNGSASTVSTWPPTDNATTRPLPPTLGTTNGAAGTVSVSGAPGGGIVLIRTGSLTGAGTITANGYTSFNVATASDAAGGAGAGGSVVVLSGGATSGALTISANGGKGGYSNYYDHGPGGGGGGGVIITNFTTGTLSSTAGISGNDGCCGGVQGNGSPKPDFAAPGGVGTTSTAGGTSPGVQGGASCLPQLQLTKSTLQPLITAATGATTTYSINVSNTRGAATNVFLLDANLPPGWTYATAPVTTYAYSPTPPGAGSSGAETTAATLPAGLPINTALTANSATAVSLRGNGVAPGLVPSAGSNSTTFGSFYVPQNGSITVTYVVSIPDTATVGTYHNPAGVIFLDPTRTTTVARMVSPATNVSANRAAVFYSSQTTYASGATVNVAGSNYDGTVAGPTTEDVFLQADLSVTKSLGTTTFTLGATGLQYIITGRNNGRPIANQVYANTQATGQLATAIVSASPAITDTLPAGMTLTAVTNNNPGVWTCAPNGTSTTFTCSASSAVYPLAAASTIVIVTATVSVSATACPGPKTNTVNITTPLTGDALPANNTATVATPIGCDANLTVSKSNGTTTVTAGGTTSYTLTFANVSPAAAADGTVIADPPAPGLSCTVANCTAGGTGVCPAAGQWPNLRTGGLTLSSFASGATLTFVLNCGVTATGQ